jgi:hypothetical protein
LKAFLGDVACWQVEKMFEFWVCNRIFDQEEVVIDSLDVGGF